MNCLTCYVEAVADIVSKKQPQLKLISTTRSACIITLFRVSFRSVFISFRSVFISVFVSFRSVFVPCFMTGQCDRDIAVSLQTVYACFAMAKYLFIS